MTNMTQTDKTKKGSPETVNVLADKTPCLYCETLNESKACCCVHCAMPLPKRHPHGSQYRRSRFLWGFVLVVIFCLVMMWFLPR